jgi:hypothetical protein
MLTKKIYLFTLLAVVAVIIIGYSTYNTAKPDISLTTSESSPSERGDVPNVEYPEKVELQKECSKAECPQQECPKPECPQQECPKTECPQQKCPKTECPQQECPKTECPQQKCPKTECPQQECPSAECPKQECTECPPESTDFSTQQNNQLGKMVCPESTTGSFRHQFSILMERVKLLDRDSLGKSQTHSKVKGNSQILN